MGHTLMGMAFASSGIKSTNGGKKPAAVLQAAARLTPAKAVQPDNVKLTPTKTAAWGTTPGQPAATAKAAPAPTVTAPAPTVTAASIPKVDPFRTGGNKKDKANFDYQVTTQHDAITKSVTDAITEHDRNTAALAKSATAALSAANDDAAARGIFRSSVRDNAVFDIQAQRALSQGQLDENLKSVRDNATIAQTHLDKLVEDWSYGDVDQQAENAKGINDQIVPDAPVEPAPVAPAPVAAPVATYSKPTPLPTNRLGLGSGLKAPGKPKLVANGISAAGKR